MVIHANRFVVNSFVGSVFVVAGLLSPAAEQQPDFQIRPGRAAGARMSGALIPGIDRILFREEQIDARIREVAAEISRRYAGRTLTRSEEHTSELQSRQYI